MKSVAGSSAGLDHGSCNYRLDGRRSFTGTPRAKTHSGRRRPFRLLTTGPAGPILRAAEDDEPTWTNAVWLVKVDANGTPGAFVRAAELGLSNAETRTDADGNETTVFVADGQDHAVDMLVVLSAGQPMAVDPNSPDNPVDGDLFVDTQLGGVAVKSGFQILREEALKHSIDEYAEIAGVNVDTLVDLAQEFTSHGKRAVADIHRGVSQHTNGFYNVVAWNTLNLIIGNYDWQGGLIRAATYDTSGKKAEGPFDLAQMRGQALAPFGVSIIRHDVKYEQTTLFEGYPAQRNWYPLASDIYQEQIPSMGDGYPYGVKALFIYMGSPVYALPGGQTNIDILADPNKIPLVVASDIVIGETSMYADYIFPDTSYLERWEFAGSHPSVPFKVMPLRQPAAAPLVETVKVYEQEMPLSLEALILGCAEKLGLPNFGPDGMGAGVALEHPDDLYLRMIANLAYAEKKDGSDAVPEAADDEVQLMTEARRHLPASVFDIARWERLTGDHWRRVVTVLNRGGRFQAFEKGYQGAQVANRHGKLINLYQEKTAGVRSAFTGRHVPGLATYIPAPLDFAGEPLHDDDDGFDLNLITYREISHAKSRTPGNYWLRAIYPENSLLLNSVDAHARGLQTGDLVRVVSPTNEAGIWDLRNGTTVPIEGRVRVIEGIRPGVTAYALGFGHFAYGSRDVTVDGRVVPGEAQRGRGVHANAAMRLDPIVTNTTPSGDGAGFSAANLGGWVPVAEGFMSDPVGGSAVFYDSRVRLVKV
jgi:tetrathionate reductase subunit A